jgi:hypothetical protein
MRQCVYNIPCKHGKCYFGETGTLLEVHIKEHKHNLRQGVMEKLKLAQHAYDKGHQICWKEAKVLQIELNNICRKYKESTYMAYEANPISQPSLYLSY